jgi:osmotically-inducible protein OsmY
VPADGETMGEIMFRGNIAMKGYLKNKKATEESFAGGWFHSGDLGVMHPDGYVKIKDRSKDIIITGQIKALLVDAKDLQSNAFKVIAERGVVYLMGRVTTREAQRASEIARSGSVSGVVKVVRVFETITEEELKRISAQPLSPQAQPKI